jgi:hypothetical protein
MYKRYLSFVPYQANIKRRSIMGHWYTKDGKPCHFQADGKDTTLRHARKQSLVPSVTGILDIVDKPGLTNYLINQTMDAAWDMPQLEDTYDEWCKEVRQKAKEHSLNARDKGSAVHKALEDDANGLVPSDHLDIVERVTEALDDEFEEEMRDVVPEASFSHRLGYGGAVDLSSPKLILDYKYKADGLKKRMVYETHIGQLAAYRCGLGYHQARCGNVFISDDEVRIVMLTEEELSWGLDYFQILLSLWKHTKKFNCGY